MGMCGQRETATLAGAQMSLPYAIATRCVNGGAALDAYAADRRRSPAIAEMLGRITLEADSSLKPLDEPTVTVRFHDGLEVSRMVPRATGAPERPMSADAIDAKFAALAAMALAPEAATTLRDAVMRLDRIDDCRALEAMLAGSADQRPLFG